MAPGQRKTAPRELREFEQLLHEFAETAALRKCGDEVCAELILRHVLVEQQGLEMRGERRQRRPQVVRDIGEELAPHFIGLPQLLHLPPDLLDQLHEQMP